MTPYEQVKDLRERLDSSLDHYRTVLRDCLEGLTDEEARRSLVPSRPP